MREPPLVTESEIVAAVETRYGISSAALLFLALGNDSATFVYRLDARDGAAYFCKLRTGAGFNLASLAIPQFLHAQGIPHILAPLCTLDNELYVMLQSFALTLYPFIEQGRTAAGAGLSDSQWREFGTAVRAYHSLPLAPELTDLLAREQFVPKQRALIPILSAAIERASFANDAERELADFWRAQQPVIQDLVDRTDMLGAQLRQSSAPRVLCHADMHTYNILMNPANDFWLVDWDEVILALPERDLMFVVRGISSALVTPKQTVLFLQGYGSAPLDATALTYYRFAWAVQDMAAYGESVFLLPDQSSRARAQAVDGFKRLFEPGEIVDIALSSGSSSNWPD